MSLLVLMTVVIGVAVQSRSACKSVCESDCRVGSCRYSFFLFTGVLYWSFRSK